MKLHLDIPDSLYESLADAAAKDHSSVEQLATLAIAEKLASRYTIEMLSERARRANLARFDELIKMIPDIEPDDYDKI